MCVVSMVHDSFHPRIRPWVERVVPMSPEPFHPQRLAPEIDLSPDELRTIRKILDDYKKANAAARVVDDLTGQPDCIDEEKQAMAREIEELRRRLSRYEESDQSSTGVAGR